MHLPATAGCVLGGKEATQFEQQKWHTDQRRVEGTQEDEKAWELSIWRRISIHTSKEANDIPFLKATSYVL